MQYRTATSRGAASASLLFKYGAGAAVRVLALLSCLLLLDAAASNAEGAEELKFAELYSEVSSLGITLSDKLKSLDGRDVAMTGFMAPPLRPSINFFVLTRSPMSICPFCSSDSDWPIDIVAVYVEKRITSMPFDRPIRVEGRLELGTKTDEATGFVSLVRIYAHSLREE
ncbi:MAG: hypothetical protein LBQ36_05235 [Synergistaceae bacterium]|jgi:hypothetical protein|nr:hypothetical protein [Synergistaceae bacterium]